MKVLITDNTHPVLQERLQAAGHQCLVVTDCNYVSLLEMIKDYDALVVRSKIQIDRNFLDNARNLKCIGRVGAGMETIDVAYAEQLGICCLNSPEGNRTAVGEHTVGLLLALFNHMARADAEVRQGMWHREANRGIEVCGHTIGIIGFGNMGSAFAGCLQGFGCSIVAYDKYKPEGYAPQGVEEVSLDELQRRADVVSLHVPLTEETHHLVNSSFIGTFHHPFYLINTSRGAVVDTNSLAQAIQQGKVIGAALDVLEYEDMSRDAIDLASAPEALRFLLNSPKTLFTPHVAGWTIESKYKLAAVLADKINAVLC